MKMNFLSLKVALISTGILSMAVALKLTVPIVSHFILNEAPTIWSFILTCFTPPYLYLLLNLIILTIVVTSKFHNHHHHPPPEPLPFAASFDGTPSPVQIPAPVPVEISEITPLTNYNAFVLETDETVAVGNESNDSAVYVVDENTPVKTTVIEADDSVLVSSLKKNSSEFVFNDENEKPPASSRFRKTVRSSPEGGKVNALRVTKTKKQDTLENTWKTITEGRAMPLNRHLKKSDTFESQPRRSGVPLADLNGGVGGGGGVPMMKKSETFGGREKSVSPGSGGKMRKESSLSQDELNRRVEAFINKFNAEMRLQRQESLRQYREMVNGRAC